jgi:type I restriction enzyme, S subunit
VRSWPTRTAITARCIRGSKKFGADGVPFLTAKSLDGGEIDIEGAPRLADERADALSFGFVRPNDVLLSHNATIGRVAVVPQFDGRLLVGTSLTYFRLNPQNLLPRYFAAYLAGTDFQNQLEAVMSHSTRNQVPITAQRMLSVVVPPLDVQHMIADTLGSLNDKIEQNRRTGRALERLARDTFKAWFVDFEPVKVKAAGAARFPGMSPAAFAALPVRLADSSLGPVPEGWEVRPLSAVCEIVSGGTPKRSMAAFWEGDVPWYSVRDAPPDGMPWVYSTSEKITKAGLDGSAATLVPVGCTIISARGTVGRLALVARPMAFNQSCYGLLPIEGASYHHLYLLLRQTLAELQQRTHGSVFDTITRQTFDGVSVVRPDSALLQQFERAVAPLFEMLLGLLKESSKLAELRDYLLPRLLSGTVRVEVRHG